MTSSSARERSAWNDSARLSTWNAWPETPSRNMSAVAAEASSKSNALSMLTGTETAHSSSAPTNALRLPLRSPQAVTSSSAPASSVNVRLVSSTSVGTRWRSASRRSEGWDRNADHRSTAPIAATARASALRVNRWLMAAPNTNTRGPTG